MDELQQKGLEGADLPDTLARVAAVLAAMQLGFESPAKMVELTEHQAYGIWLWLGVCSDTLRRTEEDVLNGALFDGAQG